MKKILLTIVGLLVLVVLVLGVLVFVSPTDFKVERDVVINKPRAEVFGYLKMLKNQNEWGPWVRKDPKIKLSYSGTDGEVGFVSRWDSEHDEVGAGEQEIMKIVDGEKVELKIRFKKPWESESDAYLTAEDAGEGKTKVRWGFTGNMARPMNLMLVFTDFEGIVGKDFEEGLGHLKTNVEKLSSPEPEKESDEKDKKDKEDKE